MNFNAISSKKEISLYLFEKKLIRAILGVLILFSILTGIVFYSLEKQSYNDSLVASDQVIANQITSIYELYVQNIRDLCNHSAIYDNALFTSNAEYHLSTDGKREILSFLTGLSVMNEYIHSCYLYFLQDNLVFSSYSMPTAVTQLDTFYDRNIFAELPVQSPVLLEPRFLNIKSDSNLIANKPLVMTLIIATPISSYQKTSYLVINIDAQKLYAQIFDKLQIQNYRNFYIVGSNDNIIFHNNMDHLFTNYEDLDTSEENLIISSSYSSRFNWTFVLESTVPPIQSSIIKFCIVIIIILVILLIVTTLMALSYTIPVKKMLQSSRNLRWRYLLTSGQSANDSTSIQTLNLQAEFPDCTAFAAMSFQLQPDVGKEKFPEALFEAFHSVSESWNFSYHPVQLSDDCICIILGFLQQQEDVTHLPLPMIANEILDIVERQLYQSPICSISSVKNGCALLHEAWLEICQIDKYSYSFTQPIRCYTEIISKSESYTFPQQYEKQLLNNLLVGNLDTCRFYSEKILSSFVGKSYILDNNEIQKYLYLMQNNILSHLASMPIPINPDPMFSPDSCTSLKELQEEFDQYLAGIIEKINSRDEDDKVILYTAVIDYIGQHYQENSICLNMVADYFSLNTNYISKIVKEMTGKNFTSYITFRRIEKSKELLMENRLTVNEISEAVGFSYPYYFIRKFKESEGITPGQYGNAIPEDVPTDFE